MMKLYIDVFLLLPICHRAANVEKKFAELRMGKKSFPFFIIILHPVVRNITYSIIHFLCNPKMDDAISVSTKIWNILYISLFL